MILERKSPCRLPLTPSPIFESRRGALCYPLFIQGDEHPIFQLEIRHTQTPWLKYISGETIFLAATREGATSLLGGEEEQYCDLPCPIYRALRPSFCGLSCPWDSLIHKRYLSKESHSNSTHICVHCMWNPRFPSILDHCPLAKASKARTQKRTRGTYLMMMMISVDTTDWFYFGNYLPLGRLWWWSTNIPLSHPISVSTQLSSDTLLAPDLVILLTCLSMFIFISL